MVPRKGRRAKQWTSTRQTEALGRHSSRDLEVDVDVTGDVGDGVVVFVDVDAVYIHDDDVEVDAAVEVVRTRTPASI